MAWVAVEKGGKEEIFVNKPYRKRGNSNILRFCNPIYWTDEDVCKYGNKDTKIELSKGSIKKLIGRDLDWSNDPVELIKGGQIMKYRKKPVIIEAVRWTGDNEEDIKRFAPVAAVFKYIVSNDKITSLCMEKPQSGYIEAVTLEINTLEGVMQASLGDYIIRGVNGEYYPCKPDIFEKTYEKAE